MIISSTTSQIKQIDPSFLLFGQSFQESVDVIPQELHQQFTTKHGSSDLTSNIILSEIIYWYRPQIVKDDEGIVSYSSKFQGDAWQTSYAYFEEKFGFKHERTRRVLVRLEDQGTIKRDYRTVTIKGQRYPNRLFIHLCPKFFKSLFAKKAIKSNLNTYSNISQTDSFGVHQSEGVSPPNQGDHIDNKNKEIYIKNRSINFDENNSQIAENKYGLESKSNFEKDIFNDKKIVSANQLLQLETNSVVESPKEIVAIDKKEPVGKSSKNPISKLLSRFAKVEKTLTDFYPLSEEDGACLRSMSGRQFDLNAMNEILQDMSKRLSDRVFNNKKAFMSYMAVIFKHEMRQEEKINNITFKIKANLTQEEKHIRKREKFLNDIEDATSKSGGAIFQEDVFKRNIVMALTADKAYDFLSSYSSMAKIKLSAIERLIDDSIVKIEKYNVNIKLNTHVLLDERTIEKIKAQLNIIFGKRSSDQIISIESVNIEMPDKYSSSEKKHQFRNNAEDFRTPSSHKHVWDKVLWDLMQYYESKGEGLHKSWFCKLSELIDDSDKTVTLITPSGFITEWINQHYFEVIANILSKYGYELKEIVHGQ